MLYVDRVNYIKQMLAKNNSVTVVELSRDLGVSGETIRRDLNTLTKDDPMIVRVHGGACRVTPDADPPYEFRQISRVEEKSKIANACFSRISEGDFLFLDSSTTTLYLAKRIAASELNLTVITNSVGVINELRHNKNIKLICIGGKYTDATHSFVGSTSLIDLSNIFAGIIMIVIWILKPANVWVFVALQCVAWLGLGVFSMVSWALITDVIDYSELKNGVREDGSVYAMYSFARKLGQALAAGLSGWLLEWIGYDSIAASNGLKQTQEVLDGIFSISTLVPALGFVLLAAVLWFWYPLRKKLVDANVAALAEKHGR